MPFIQNGVEICTVARGCDMPKAQAMFPDYSWLFNLQVALNLAKAVAYLHSRNCIVSDLNCKNIMVSPGGLITMLDNDSFDLLDAASGMHFRCCAARRIIWHRSCRGAICVRPAQCSQYTAIISPLPSTFSSCL